MVEVAASRAGSLVRRGLIALAVLAGLGVVFKALEPEILGSIGSKAMPAGPYPVTSRPAQGWDDAGESARAWLEAARAALDAPALSAAVSVDGEIVWVGVTGYADLVDGREATPETTFRIGGSAKPVTSIAMGALIASGDVRLDAPISDVLPDIAMPLRHVTLRQAMSNTAGVRDYGVCLCFPITEYYSRTHYETQRDALRPFERSRLLFRPGEGYAFSSYGFTVAGAAIEAVTEKSFADALDEIVLDPLGLASIRADSGAPGSTDARFYTVSSGRYFETFRVDLTNRLAAGGLLATPSDMARLGHQMIEPTLFDEATRDLLMRPQPLADGGPNPESYALGWRYEANARLGETIATARLHHDGSSVGSTSAFAVYPEYGMVVSVMANRSAAGREPLLQPHADALAEIFAVEIEQGAAER